MLGCDKWSFSRALLLIVSGRAFIEGCHKRFANLWMTGTAISNQETQGLLHVVEIGAIDN